MISCAGSPAGRDISPRILRAFHATEYCVSGVTIRIGQRCRAMDRLLSSLGAGSGAFLTAWNPGARRHPVQQNLRSDRAMQGWLRRIAALPGIGVASGWHEEHWLLATDPRRAAALGRRFRQAAVVVVRRGQRARLCFLATRQGYPLARTPRSMPRPARST